MGAKYYPTPEELDTIMTMYKNNASYAEIGRTIGISGAVAKRVITEFNEGTDPTKKSVKSEKSKSKNGSQNHSFTYSGEVPIEPPAPISKAQFYYQLQNLMLRMIENVSR